MASLSVSLPPVTPRCKGGVEGREVAEREERRWRNQSTPSSVFLFLGRRDLLCADQWRAAAALSAGVVGAGAIFVVGALRQLVDGRQLVAMRVVVVVVIVIQTFNIEMFRDSLLHRGWTEHRYHSCGQLLLPRSLLPQAELASELTKTHSSVL